MISLTTRDTSISEAPSIALSRLWQSPSGQAGGSGTSTELLLAGMMSSLNYCTGRDRSGCVRLLLQGHSESSFRTDPSTCPIMLRHWNYKQT